MKTNNRRRRVVRDNASLSPSELIAAVLAGHGGKMTVQQLINEAGAKVAPERAYRFHKNRCRHREDDVVNDMDAYIRKGREGLITSTLSNLQRTHNVTITDKVVRPTSRMLINFTDFMTDIIRNDKLREVAKRIMADIGTCESHTALGMRRALRHIMIADGHDMTYKRGSSPRD